MSNPSFQIWELILSIHWVAWFLYLWLPFEIFQSVLFLIHSSLNCRRYVMWIHSSVFKIIWWSWPNMRLRNGCIYTRARTKHAKKWERDSRRALIGIAILLFPFLTLFMPLDFTLAHFHAFKNCFSWLLHAATKCAMHPCTGKRKLNTVKFR